MRAIALLLGLLTVAGCLSGGDDGAGSPSSPVPTSTSASPLPATTLAQPTVRPELRLGPGAGEPNIAVAPDGTIYITPIDALYRSKDDGKTFEALGTPGCGFAFGLTGAVCPPGREQTISATDGHGDGDISIDATGRVHWLGLFGAGAIPYQHTDDQGVTWSSSVDLSATNPSDNDGTGADREWIDARLDGTVYASWRDSSENGIIASRTSFDGGMTWLNVTTMSPDAVGGPIVHGPVPGQVFEAMTTFSASPVPTEGQGASIDLARSFDHGQTWEVIHVLEPDQSVQLGLIGFPTSIFPVVAADDGGTLYIVFSTDIGNVLPNVVPSAPPKPLAKFGVFLMVSHDLGETWSSPKLLSDPAHVSIMPFIAAGAAGRVAITWYENTLGLPADVLPDLWNVKLWESITADQDAPTSVTVQLNDLPNHIGAVCTSGTGCLAGDRSMLDYFEVAIDMKGQPVVTWAYSVVGTGLGVAVLGVDIYFGGLADGTPLR